MRSVVLAFTLVVSGCAGREPTIDAGLEVADAGAKTLRLEEIMRVTSGMGTFTFACGVVGDTTGGLYAALDTDTGLEGPLRGMRDLVIVRRDAADQTVWMRQLGDESALTPLFTRGCALDVDPAGNVYLAGLVNGRGTFLGLTLPALYTALVASWAPDGTQRWVRLLGSAGGAEAMAISVVGDEVRVLGYAKGGLEGVGGLGNGDVFLARLDAAQGGTAGVQLFGGAAEDLPVGLSASGLAYTTTTGVLGPIVSTVRVPLPAGDSTSLDPGLERLAASDSAMITASTEEGDGGLVVHLRRIDAQGRAVAERSLEPAATGTLRGFACGAGRCLVALSVNRGTKYFVVKESLELQATLQVEVEDGGMPPMVRNVAVVGDDFVVAGSVNGDLGADAVLWRLQ